MSLSDRIATGLKTKFGESSVQRIIKCWDTFAKGESLERYVNDDKETLQVAQCFVEGLEAKSFHPIEEHPWARRLESQTDVIRAELEAYNARTAGMARSPAAMLGEVGGTEAGWLPPRDVTGGDYGPEWKTLGLQVGRYERTSMLAYEQRLSAELCCIFIK
jgi:hypothetical protein